MEDTHWGRSLSAISLLKMQSSTERQTDTKECWEERSGIDGAGDVRAPCEEELIHALCGRQRNNFFIASKYPVFFILLTHPLPIFVDSQEDVAPSVSRLLRERARMWQEQENEELWVNK